MPQPKPTHLIPLLALAAGCAPPASAPSSSVALTATAAQTALNGIRLTQLNKSHGPESLQYTWYFESSEPYRFQITSRDGSSVEQGAPTYSDLKSHLFIYHVTYKLSRATKPGTWTESISTTTEPKDEMLRSLGMSGSTSKATIGLNLQGPPSKYVKEAAEARGIDPDKGLVLFRIGNGEEQRCVTVRFLRGGQPVN